MWRTTAAGLLLGGLVGCMSVDTGPETGGMKPNWGTSYPPPAVPGVQGPYGAKVPMAAPYSYAPPGSQWAAQQMMRSSVPMNMLQFNGGGVGPGGAPMQAPGGGILSPPGVPMAPGAPGGIAPMGFPGPGAGGGVMPANIPPGGTPPGGIMQAQSVYNPVAAARFQAPRTQVRFSRPTGMKVYWYTVGSDGKPGYSTTPIETPGRYNFAQAAIYRLKLGNIEGRPGLELYPTMEVVPCNVKTEAFLAHNAVPVDFTAEDFKQVAEGNYIEKVIYLPDPQYQDAAGTGIDEIVSTRLEPGQSPIQEALKRGSILLVIKMGNIDQEAPNTPPLVSPGPAAPAPAPPPGFGGAGPHGPAMPMLQVPYLGMPNAAFPKMGPDVPMIAPPGALPIMPGLTPPAPGPMGLPPVPGATAPNPVPGYPPSLPPSLPNVPPSAPGAASPGLNPRAPWGGAPDLTPTLPPVPTTPGANDTSRRSAPSLIPVSGPTPPNWNGPPAPPALPPLPAGPALSQ